jgi:hypothetical protein
MTKLYDFKNPDEIRRPWKILPLTAKKFCVTILRQATVYGFSWRMRFDLAINGMVLGFFKNSKIPTMRDERQGCPFIHVRAPRVPLLDL